MLRHLLAMLGLWPVGTRGVGSTQVYEVPSGPTKLEIVAPARKVEVIQAPARVLRKV